MGRPIECNEEVIETALDYIDNYKDYDDVIPSVAGMCKVLNRARSTLYKWADEDLLGFSDILNKCLDNQEAALLNGGLSGNYNSTITKLILTKHGYSDKQDIEVGGTLGVAERIQRARERDSTQE